MWTYYIYTYIFSTSQLVQVFAAWRRETTVSNRHYNKRRWYYIWLPYKQMTVTNNLLLQQSLMNHLVMANCKWTTLSAMLIKLPTLAIQYKLITLLVANHVRFVYYSTHHTCVTVLLHVDYLAAVTAVHLPGKFFLKQVHFHWGTEPMNGSEHLIGGVGYAGEVG